MYEVLCWLLLGDCRCPLEMVIDTLARLQRRNYTEPPGRDCPEMHTWKNETMWDRWECWIQSDEIKSFWNSKRVTIEHLRLKWSISMNQFGIGKLTVLNSVAGPTYLLLPTGLMAVETATATWGVLASRTYQPWCLRISFPLLHWLLNMGLWPGRQWTNSRSHVCWTYLNIL